MKNLKTKLRKVKSKLMMIPVYICLFLTQFNMKVFAEGEEIAGDSEQLWNKIVTLLETWVWRIGVVVIVVGGILFGIGQQRDEPSMQTTGIRTMIGGVIIAGMGTFLALAL